MRAEDHGSSGQHGLDRVLSAAPDQTFADKHDVGAGIPIAQFARRVDEQDIRRGTGPLCARRDAAR
jgi:hypothetical protein